MTVSAETTDETPAGTDPEDAPERAPETEPTAESDSESADSQAEPEDAKKGRFRPGPRGLAATIVVSLLAILVFAAAGGTLWYVRTQHDNTQRNNAITVAAREEVLALLSLSPDTVQASLDKVLAGSTGGWRQQFAQEADQFTQVVHQQGVNVTATVTASAIQSADDAHATVLVAADAVIHNSASPQGYPGVYRVLMNLQAQHGVWLVSDLQFVA